MCGQWSQASQPHSGSRSPMPGSRSSPAAAASSTRCGGISRSRRAAMWPALSTARSSSRSHSSSENSRTSTSLRCAVPSRSLTTAVIRPGRTDTAPTAPARAWRRPALSCCPSSAVSSRALSHTWPHQVRVNAPPAPAAAPRRSARRPRVRIRSSSVPRSRTSSASSASVSSVSSGGISPPVPRTLSASSRLRSSIAAIRSSIVPSAISRWTCTGRSCPIRYARSVACASTAGFHQRS